jgi:hypothetical protein
MCGRIRWAFLALVSALAVTTVASAQTTSGSARETSKEAPASIAAEASSKARTKPYVMPRTPWGDPDLQGLWSNQTSTPLERPSALQGKATLTPEEAEEREEAARLNADLPPRPGDPGTYNSFWREPGIALTRTSLIVDPPDGRVPPFTAEGKARVTARQTARSARAPAGPWENYSNWERCITRGVIKLQSFYSASHQIFQAPGYVVIVQELIHEARIVPLDGRSPLSPAIRHLMGESRGRWDGDTLVVETTTFTDKNPFRGSGDTMRLVERFKRVGPDAIDYQFTVDDPQVFTRPWTVSMPMAAGGPIYEYACHEGNYSMGNMLLAQESPEKPAR